MSDELISCCNCGLVVWSSKMKQHKESECFVKTVSDILRKEKEDKSK